MSVGRLDLNSEGLLLLTNDGAVKRKLELPATGWLRRYRVRVNGRPSDATLAPLREGLEVEGQRFQPMTVTIDRQQGANAWLTVGLREGKNREIRRAMADIGLTVNRLIRLSYGPFQLGQLKPGEVQEVRGRIVRDQLGLPAVEEAPERPGRPGLDRSRGKRPGSAPRGGKPAGPGAGKTTGPRAGKPGPGGAKAPGRLAEAPKGAGTAVPKGGAKGAGKAPGKGAGKGFGKMRPGVVAPGADRSPGAATRGGPDRPRGPSDKPRGPDKPRGVTRKRR
jgi:23S rRNA pseudouridine2605 synthase